MWTDFKSDVMVDKDVAGVWMFIDDSNLWIEGKKLVGNLMKNRYFKEDPRGRVSLTSLENFILGNRERVSAILYGSEPPAVETYWSQAKSLGWVVKEFHRSQYNKKEKEVDCAISVDITKTVLNKNIERYKTKVIVLVSGDKDMRPAIEEVMRHREEWKVELVGYKHSMSNELIKMASNNPDMITCRFLDSSKVTYTQYDIKWNDIKESDKAKCGCVLYNVHRGVEKNDFHDELRELQWPYQITLSTCPGERHFFVWFLQPDQDRESFPIDEALDQNLKLLKKNSSLNIKCEVVMSYIQYKNVRKTKCVSKPQPSTANKFESLTEVEDKDFMDPPLMSRLKEMPVNCSDRDTDLERSQRLNDVGSMENWKTVESTDKRKRYQQFTKKCEFGFSCRHCLKCKYNHTDEEKNFFKAQTGRNFRQYKTKLCRNYPECSFKERCRFAHGAEQLFCSSCGKTGHSAEKCRHTDA